MHTGDINSPSLLPSNAGGNEVESEEVRGDKMVLSCLYQALTDLNLLPPELSTQLETILDRGRDRGGASDEGEKDIYENKIQMIANMKDSLIHQLTTTDNSNTLQSPILQKSPRPNTNLKYIPTTQTPRNQHHLSQYDTDQQHQQLLLLYEQQQQLNLTLQIENKDNLYSYNSSLQLLQSENDDLKALIKHIINNEMSTSYILEDYREKFALSLASPIPMHTNTSTYSTTPIYSLRTSNNNDNTNTPTAGAGAGGATNSGDGGVDSVSNLHRTFFSDIQEVDAGIEEGSELLISQPIHTGADTAADPPATPYTPTHSRLSGRRGEGSYNNTTNDDNLYVTSVQSPKGDDIVANIQQRNERLMHTVSDKLLEIGQKYRV